MLPVSAFPPRAPGRDLSPFGAPRCVRDGYVLPKGAWIVTTGGARVVMAVAYKDVWGSNPARVPGTGILPGRGRVPPQPGPIKPIPLYPPRSSNATPSTPVKSGCGCGKRPCVCPPPKPWNWPTHDQYLEGWRAWQRKTGITGEIRPRPGRRPPNWFGPCTVLGPVKTITVLEPCRTGTVLADGQNVMICGSGAMIMQAYSV